MNRSPLCVCVALASPSRSERVSDRALAAVRAASRWISMASPGDRPSRTPGSSRGRAAGGAGWRAPCAPIASGCAATEGAPARGLELRVLVPPRRVGVGGSGALGGRPPRRLRPNPGFEAWSRAELARLQARFGPSEKTNPIEPEGRVEAHRWHTRRRRDRAADLPGRAAALDRRRRPRRAAFSGTTDAGSSCRCSVPRRRGRRGGRRGRGGTDPQPIDGRAEQSYYSEFGRYHAAGPYPPDPPRGAYVVWRQGEANGFDELGFAPESASHELQLRRERRPVRGGRRLRLHRRGRV